MKCDICKDNEATIHSIRYINGEITESHICEECAKREITQSWSGVDTGLKDQNTFLKDLINRDENDTVCPECGFKFSDFKNTGYLGCPSCYSHFKKLVLPAIKRVQGSDRHTGRVPYIVTGTDEPAGSPETIDQLKVRLDEAVSLENFELAAVLRDKINLLKGKE